MGRARTGGGNDEREVLLDDAYVISMFGEGKTAAEMAAAVGCSRGPIQKAFARLGLRRPAKRRPGVGVGSSNSSWAGGRSVRTDGYVQIWTPEGQRLEHRVVMERKLGRPLTDGEVVHHKDHDKQNNHPDNLEIMSQSEHARLHAPEMHAARYGKVWVLP